MICQRMFDHFQGIVNDTTVKMRDLITTEGWPLLPELPGQRIKCRVCKQEFAKVWVHSYVCWKCDDDIRCAGKCPYERDNPPHICPHTRKCFSCQMISCHECGLVRGDGPMVLNVVRELKPDFVFLDFDQTLCSTKSGLQPIPGKHGLNPQLFEILITHPSVHIITRQNIRHKTFLENFIKAHLIAADVDPATVNLSVFCLGQSKPKITKANVMEQLMVTDDKVAIFVDDTVREHLAESVMKFKNMKRILFSTTDFTRMAPADALVPLMAITETIEG